MIKIFEKDRVIRDSKGKPLGRVIMASEYKEGEDIQVALLEIPRAFMETVIGAVVYIDGVGYKIPKDLPNVRIQKTPLKWIVNTFVLEKLS